MIAGVLKVITKGKGSETNLLLKNHIDKMSLSKNQLEIKFIYQNDQWGNQPTPNPTTPKENKQGAGAGKRKTEKTLEQGENIHFNPISDKNKDISKENKANTHKPEEKPLSDFSGSGADDQNNFNNSQENLDLEHKPTSYNLSETGISRAKNRRPKKKGGQARTSSNNSGTVQNYVSGGSSSSSLFRASCTGIKLVIGYL